MMDWGKVLFVLGFTVKFLTKSVVIAASFPLLAD